MYLNKSGLIRKIASRTGLSQKDSTNALNASLSTIQDALSYHNGVRLVGFGSFKVTHHKARNGRNPQTGKSIVISARDVPKFTPGKGLRNAVDKK